MKLLLTLFALFICCTAFGGEPPVRPGNRVIRTEVFVLPDGTKCVVREEEEVVTRRTVQTVPPPVRIIREVAPLPVFLVEVPEVAIYRRTATRHGPFRSVTRTIERR